MVLAGISRLVPSRGCKLKHVPHICPPQIRSCREHFQHMLVIYRLVALRVVALLRFRRLQRDHTIRPVLGQTDRRIRIFPVKIVKERIVVLHLADIPAIVQVVAADIRKRDERTVRLEQEQVCHRGNPCFVHLMYQVVQDPVVFYQILRHTLERDLV